ncbi:MAG: aminotransferase class I/II-fold pyridoxal phosphate-dependent enzyme, partial [Candidatus Krumholzibacteriia bacterium]
PAFASLQREVMAPYARRRAVMVEALEAAGFDVFPAGATFYVWARVPDGGASAEFCRRVLAEIDVVATPGLGFGSGGEGWFRLSLTAADADVAEGARRFRKWR